MPIAVGDRLPEVTFKTVTNDGPGDVSTSEVFADKKVALFAVPGAYTPTCHQKHMPGFLEHLSELKAKGIDDVVCTSVNDVFVMEHWGRDTGAVGKIMLLADGSAEFAKALGLDLDLGAFGLGTRSQRYAMIVDDGVVQVLNIEDTPSSAERSSAEELLKAL